MNTPRPLAGTYQLGPLLPLFNAMKEHLMTRAAAGACTAEEAITLEELTGACPAAPRGWSFVSDPEAGKLVVSAGLEI